jgi:putative transposase
MPRKTIFVVKMAAEDRDYLTQFIRRGKASARSLARARILLMADEGYSNKEIVEVLRVSRPTVNHIRKRYCQEGLDSAINEKPRSGAPPKIDGTIESQVTLLACSKPPEGKSTWTLKLLADKLVEMEVIESISTMSVQRILKKARPSLGRRLDGVLAR